MFQGVRQSSLFYILEKGDDIKLKVGQVVSVSNPQPRFNQMPISQPYGQSEMVVDIKVSVGDETLEFKQLGASQSIANSGNVVVSDNREAMSAEVEGLIRTSKQALASVPYHEKVLVSCDSILRELNPSFAKEKEQEEKIGQLEDRMVGIEGTLSDMMSMLSNALGQAKVKKAKEEE